MSHNASPPVILTSGDPSVVPSLPIMTLTASILAAVMLGDWLIWGHGPGLSLGIYALLLSVLVLINRQPIALSRRQCFICVLAIASAAQTAIRPSFSNALALVVLLLVLAGDTYFATLKTAWMRWVQAILSTLAFAFIWYDYCNKFSAWFKHGDTKIGSRLARFWEISWLAVVLVVVFAIILGFGNAMLGDVIANGYSALVDALYSLNIPGPVRWIFWLCLATVALVLLMPRFSQRIDRKLSGEFPRFASPRHATTMLRSLVALVAVNVLFFFTNSLDVAYLWMSDALPHGIGYAEYVHQGVGSLIVAVLLSAVILTLIFQQDEAAIRSRWLKGLALCWVVQNLFLGLGVLLRLQLYIEAHWLTPRRIYVAAFLLLVAVGYGLLVRHILKCGSLKTLLLGNACAVFILFFTLQFINVPAYVADYNYRQWLADPTRNVAEMEFEPVLGREVIPLLIQVSESGLDTPAVADARSQLIDIRRTMRAEAMNDSWQSWQWRQQQFQAMLAMDKHASDLH